MIRQNNEPRYHPTQKPLGVLKWVFTQFPKPPRSVLDPFLGSGTTLIAARAFGARAAGIEKIERYCEIAAKRLEQETLEFDEPKAADASAENLALFG